MTRLAPEIGGASKGPLKRCGDALARRNAHRYHARAFWDGDRTPAAGLGQRVGGRLGRLLPPPEQRHVGAYARQGAREHLPKPARAAGDQRYAPFKAKLA